MFENEFAVSQIALAMYVPPNKGTALHPNRPFHGLVLNGRGKRADYVFEDGFVLKTEENSLHYLPKGASYKVVVHSQGEGCWAINFDVSEPMGEKPFSLKLQNAEMFLPCFKSAVNAFVGDPSGANPAVMKELYTVLYLLKKEAEKQYVPGAKMLLLKPALDKMDTDYCSADLSVEELSRLCGISVAYFRRLFTAQFGISPKEYLIRRRMARAEKLLSGRQFSVGEVAQLCGYGEPCHFSREFKKHFGVSPQSYEK